MKKDNYIRPASSIEELNMGYALMQDESLLGTGTAGEPGKQNIIRRP